MELSDAPEKIPSDRIDPGTPRRSALTTRPPQAPLSIQRNILNLVATAIYSECYAPVKNNVKILCN
jgi:hypothetical protein